MKLSKLIEIIKNKVDQDGPVYDLASGKETIKKIDPEINIGFKLKGEGAEFYDFEIEYDEIFIRDVKEISIIVKQK